MKTVIGILLFLWIAFNLWIPFHAKLSDRHDGFKYMILYAYSGAAGFICFISAIILMFIKVFILNE